MKNNMPKGGLSRRRRLSKLAGKRFIECRRATRALAEWRKKAKGAALRVHIHSEFSGEAERKNPHRIWKARRDFSVLLREGKQLGRAFVKAQRGLVPKVWLDRYVESRLTPIRKLGKAGGLA